MTIYNEATIKKLAEIMQWLKSKNYTVAMLLGAGMSVSAGIPAADAMIEDIQRVFPFTKEDVGEKIFSAYMAALPPGIRKDMIREYSAKAKVNLAHLYLAALVKEGYVDRILTTNFDQLITKALTLSNISAAVYDFAASNQFILGGVSDPSVFYLHGQSDGFTMLSTSEEVNKLSARVSSILEDTAIRRCWIVVGYSGKNDPVFKRISELSNVEYGMFWVGYNGQEPAPHILKDVLTEEAEQGLRKPKQGVHYINESGDADAFFIKLAKQLGIPEPRLISKPFTSLKENIEAISDVRKDQRVTSLTQKATRDIDKAIKLFEAKQILSDIDLLQKTREVLIFEKYSEIDDIYDQVRQTNLSEARENLADALHNYRIELTRSQSVEPSPAEISRISELSKKENELRLVDRSGNIVPEEVLQEREMMDNLRSSSRYIDVGATDHISPRTRYFIETEQLDCDLTEAGLNDAADILGCPPADVRTIAFKVYGRDLLKCHIHRIYVNCEYFAHIEEDHKKDKTINIIRSILDKTGLSLYYQKSHQFAPCLANGDSIVMGCEYYSPCMLHIQVSYFEKDDLLKPLEVLVTKYQEPINISGFLIDKVLRSQDYFSKTAELNLRNQEYRTIIKDHSNKFYLPFTNINNAVNRFYD